MAPITPANAGTNHNELLDGIAAVFDTTEFDALSTTSDKIAYVDDIVTQYLVDSGGANWSNFGNTDVLDSIESWWDEETTYVVSWTELKTDQDFIDSMTTVEVQFIDESMAALSFDPSSMTKAKVCSTLFARADSLIDEWGAQDWGTDGSEEMAGELSLAYLSTAQSSTEYWNVASFEPWGTGTAPGPSIIYNIVQADAAGFLVAWTIAAFVDELPTEDERINAGVRGAATASGINVGMKLLTWLGLA